MSTLDEFQVADIRNGKDEAHLQSEFERYYGSPIIAWERWEAWQWAIDAYKAQQSDAAVKP